MQDVVDAAHRARGDVAIGQIAFDELHVGDVGQVRPLAGDQTVHDADGFAATSQLLTQVRADETGAAGDEIVSHVNSALTINEEPSTG